MDNGVKITQSIEVVQKLYKQIERFIRVMDSIVADKHGYQIITGKSNTSKEVISSDDLKRNLGESEFWLATHFYRTYYDNANKVSIALNISLANTYECDRIFKQPLIFMMRTTHANVKIRKMLVDEAWNWMPYRTYMNTATEFKFGRVYSKKQLPLKLMLKTEGVGQWELANSKDIAYIVMPLVSFRSEGDIRRKLLVKIGIPY